MQQVFKLNKRQFEKKTMTVFKNCLVKFFKCQSIRGFLLNEVDQVFKFKKTYKINSIFMKDKKEHWGKYKIEDCDDNKHMFLTIIYGK